MHSGGCADTFLNMKRVLIIHHLETMWENGYRHFATSFEELQEKFIRHLENSNYDFVILTRFEDWELDDSYFPALAEKISAVHDYAYGWEREQVADQIENFTDGGKHSEVVYLADWMRKLKGCDVRIAGAFDGECIEDLEIALRALEVQFSRIEALIVG